MYFVQCTVQCTCSIRYKSQYSEDSSGRFYIQVKVMWVFLRVYFKLASYFGPYVQFVLQQSLQYSVHNSVQNSVQCTVQFIVQYNTGMWGCPDTCRVVTSKSVKTKCLYVFLKWWYKNKPTFSNSAIGPRYQKSLLQGATA